MIVEQRKSRVWWAAGLIVCYLLLAFAWQDLPLWAFDDAMYLASGLHVHVSMFANDVTSMPLYAYWFKALGYVCHDPVWRQFLGWGLLVVAVGLLPLARRVPLAWLYTAVLVALPFFMIGPYVSLFAALLFLAGMIWVLRRSLSFVDAGTMVCVCCFAVAFARPEYQYGVYLSALGVIIAAVAEKGRKVWGGLIVVVLLVSAMAYVGLHSDSGRSGVAFAQHYNLHAADEGKIPQAGAWDSTYAYQQFGIDIHANGGRHSIMEFVKANPKKFLGHVERNVLSGNMFAMALLSLLVLWLPWSRGRTQRAETNGLRAASFFLLLIALPTFSSLALVYPDRHYIAIVFPALLLLGLQEIDAAMVERIERYAGGILAVAFVMMIGVVMLKTHDERRNGTFRHGLRTISCLRGVEQQFGSTGGLVFNGVGVKSVYLDSSMRFVEASDVKDFPGWVKTEHPFWVLMTPTFEAGQGMTDAQMKELLLGYSVQSCPRINDLTVYVAR